MTTPNDETGFRTVPWERKRGEDRLSLPPMSDEDQKGGSCSSVWRRWLCTRKPNHDGTHRAGVPSGRVVAEWRDEDVTS